MPELPSPGPILDPELFVPREQDRLSGLVLPAFVVTSLFGALIFLTAS